MPLGAWALRMRRRAFWEDDQFNTSSATARDPTPIDRVSRAYDRRMGRRPLAQYADVHRQGPADVLLLTPGGDAHGRPR